LPFASPDIGIRSAHSLTSSAPFKPRLGNQAIATRFIDGAAPILSTGN
jgi:hypothetical protein